MFRKTGIILLLSAMAMICAALWTVGAAEQIPEPGSILSDDEVYAQILDMYVAGMLGDEAIIESNEFNFSAYQAAIYSNVEPLYTIGYTFLDVNGDGRVELLIADATEDRSADGIIFDVWSASEGNPRLFLQGWERNRLYLTPPDENGCYGFYMEGSDSAFESIYQRGTFTVDGAVILVALEYNEESPEVWKLDDAAVTEETANMLINIWSSDLVQLNLTPLALWRQ